MTSNHQGCWQRGLDRQPLCLQRFRTAIRSSFSVLAGPHPRSLALRRSKTRCSRGPQAPGLRNLRGCSSTDPIEDICWMEPPSSDAEPLRDEQPAKVRASHRLLVTADELCHLKRRDQSVRQSVRRRQRFRRRLGHRRSMRRFCEDGFPHRGLRCAGQTGAVQ